MVTQYLQNIYENESWKIDYDDATLCWNVEQALRIGVDILKRIEALGAVERVTVSVALSQGKSFLWWLDRSTLLVKAIHELRDKDYEVEGSVEFLRHFQRLNATRQAIAEMVESLSEVKSGNFTVLDSNALLCRPSAEG